MNFNEAKYKKRLSQLIPVDCYKYLKKKNPTLYFQKRMAKLDDDYKSIYWYSIWFLSKELSKLNYYETRKYYFDREIFRCKYIKLGKLELCFQLLEYVFDNEKVLFVVGNTMTILIEYLIYLISNVNFHLVPLFLHKYESDRIDLIKGKASDMFWKTIDFRNDSYMLFFQIFYKGNVEKYNLDNGLLKIIYEYTFE